MTNVISQRNNIATTFENHVILQHCHNVGTMLKTTLDQNIHITFRQHSVGVVRVLVPSVEVWPNINVQEMLCELWCPTLKSDQTVTFWQCYHNVVATLKNNINFQFPQYRGTVD